MEAHPQDLPQIDLEAIRIHCEMLFGHLDGYVPVRFVGEKGTGNSSARQKFFSPGKLAEEICRAAPRAAARNEAIYVVPCTVRNPTHAREADIVETGVLVVDIDEGDTDGKRDHLIQHLGEPSMVVASGGITDEGKARYHLYWRLSEAAAGDDLARAVRLRALAARKVGADDSFRTVTQPIRVAGTIHGKYGNLAAVRLLRHSTIEYHLADLAAAVEAMPQCGTNEAWETLDSARPRTPTARELMTTVIREGGQDEETRFQALSRIMGHWIRQVRLGRATLPCAWTAILDQNAATIRPPWDERRLQREFAAILRVDVERNGPMPTQDHEDAAPVSGPDFSEDALAQEFVRDFGRDWRHVGVWGQWLNWTGTVWKRDAVGAVFEAVRTVCRTAALWMDRPSEQRRLATARTIHAVMRIASHDPRIAIDAEVLDRHDMLLNTPGGLIDLETGAVGEHERRHMLTQVTHASSGHGCPVWTAFLETVTGNDQELMAYLARVAGYCLTGSTKEQVFFLLHGSGANGKSV